ncbi:MAG: hypothetical protein OXC14_20805 [Rhodospirillaceae bacterium]|nr:hypothetical protein [Rhodospirillaceae bacterium]
MCLHGGAFLGQSHSELPCRFVRRYGKPAVEERWNACRLKLCRIVDRALYRELGVQHLGLRRDTTTAVALRRLLLLDYVLSHLDAPWLPTDDEKMAEFTTAGVPKDVWPGRVHAGIDGARRRHFIQRLPLDAERATFVFVQPRKRRRRARCEPGAASMPGCGLRCRRRCRCPRRRSEGRAAGGGGTGARPLGIHARCRRRTL